MVSKLSTPYSQGIQIEYLSLELSTLWVLCEHFTQIEYFGSTFWALDEHLTPKTEYFAITLWTLHEHLYEYPIFCVNVMKLISIQSFHFFTKLHN